jgi:hypothetical protein
MTEEEWIKNIHNPYHSNTPVIPEGEEVSLHQQSINEALKAEGFGR